MFAFNYAAYHMPVTKGSDIGEFSWNITQVCLKVQTILMALSYVQETMCFLDMSNSSLRWTIFLCIQISSRNCTF